MKTKLTSAHQQQQKTSVIW